MDFELPEELRILKAGLRRFVDNELIPIERQTTDGEAIKPEYLERFEQRAKDLGIWQLDVPEEYGGGGMPILARAIVWEELSRTIAHTGARRGHHRPVRARHSLFAHGRDEGEVPAAVAARREESPASRRPSPMPGPIPAACAPPPCATATITSSTASSASSPAPAKADFMQLMVATDRSKGSRGGISCFIVDMDTPGVKLGACYETMMGDKPWEIVLENVRVPATHRVGEEGDGMRFGQQWLNIGRVKHGARALGVAERCLEMATSYAKQRSTFGRPLADRQAVQWMLADMFIELQAARLLVYKTAARLDQGEEAREDAYVAKYFADEMAFKAADQCMQIHGGIALTTDLPIEKMWRQQRSYRITEGASEVMKMVIARHVLKTYG